MSRWRQWRALARDDRRSLAQAAMLLVYARLRLPFIDFRADPHSAQRADSGVSSAAALARAQVVARIVGIAAGHSPVRVSCLHRSLVLWWLLRREGIPCQLRLGAHAAAGQFEAHAWVRCAGVALNQIPADLARYRPFGEAVVPVRRAARWRFALRRAG
jgi:Transglutaminase-like superfamily